MMWMTCPTQSVTAAAPQAAVQPETTIRPWLYLLGEACHAVGRSGVVIGRQFQSVKRTCCGEKENTEKRINVHHGAVVFRAEG